MDYEWIYERLEPYYFHGNDRLGTDPMVLIQHLFGISSLRQTYQQIQDNLSNRWLLEYGLLDKIPHYATVRYRPAGTRHPPYLLCQSPVVPLGPVAIRKQCFSGYSFNQVNSFFAISSGTSVISTLTGIPFASTERQVLALIPLLCGSCLDCRLLLQLHGDVPCNGFHQS